MVSLPYSHPLMYSQKHASNLAYPTTAPTWYPNYSTHHAAHHPNNQFLNAAQTPNGILDSDSAAAASFYNHHHMLHTSSPEWNSHDNYNLSTPSSQFFPNGMTPPTSLHLSPTINSHHTSNSANTNGDNLQNGLQNIPPSPPITVNSACSEMSSPGIGSNGNGGVIGSGDASPNMNSNNNNLSRSKSPYEWMKKPSYQSQPNADALNPLDVDFKADSNEYVLSGKTRTKDKYRVVYTDYQRLELEKEYHMSHYITIRRKSELAQSLQLSERQVKIWFQNRRAKDRKQTKKRDGPVCSNSILSNSSVGLSLQHHNMGPSSLGAGSMYGLEIKPKLEPGLLPPGHHPHSYSHLHQAHASHPMHHLSTMGMNLIHQSHMHHSAAAAAVALPPSISSSPATSIQSQAHLSS